MDDGVPRRYVDELVTRWTLTNLRLVVVEGPADQRAVRLVQQEEHCRGPLKDLDVWTVDAIEVPATLLAKHGLHGVGAKQRVVAFAREIESRAIADGFRGVVDRDLDPLIPIDLRSLSLLYTDFGCMYAYFWTSEVLRRLLVQFKAEAAISTQAERSRLYHSIGSACLDLAAVRLAMCRNPEWDLKLHQSDKALSLQSKKLSFDLIKYVDQCRPARGKLNAARAAVREIRENIKAIEPLDIANSHDLIYLLVYALRECSSAPRRLIDEESVAASLVAYGVMDSTLAGRPMFAALSSWVAGELVDGGQAG